MKRCGEWEGCTGCESTICPYILLGVFRCIEFCQLVSKLIYANESAIQDLNNNLLFVFLHLYAIVTGGSYIGAYMLDDESSPT